MITLRELLNLLKKGQAPAKIIYDLTVYQYKEGQYVDRFGEPFTIGTVCKALTTEKNIEVIA